MNQFYKPLYEDTDSEGTALKYCKNDVQATKEVLNSFYGMQGRGRMKNYICVRMDNQPMIIFKDKIVAIKRCADNDNAVIHGVGGIIYECDTKYTDVVKMMFH